MRLVGIASPGEFIEVFRAFESDLADDYLDQAEALHRTCGEIVSNDAPDEYGGALLKAQEHARELIEQAKAQAERIIASAHARADEIAAEGGDPSGCEQITNKVQKESRADRARQSGAPSRGTAAPTRVSGGRTQITGKATITIAGADRARLWERLKSVHMEKAP